MRGVLVVLGVLGCGGSGVGHGTSFESRWYQVQFKSARLDARRADGSPWHTRAPDNTGAVIGGLLVGLATGNPTIGLSVGNALQDGGGDPIAPAPFIDMKIGSETFRVSSVGQTYAPAWDQPIALDVGGRHPSDRVVIQIGDAVDNATIGQVETTIGALLGKSSLTFTNVGQASTLDVTIVPLQIRPPRSYEIMVPAHIAYDTLVKTGMPEWMAVPVWNGDTVSIEAVGSVCPSSPSECFDPTGAAEGRWRDHNIHREGHHASLIAATPGAMLEIGHTRTFRVEQSGLVMLFVNDKDVGNNSGWFRARVVVTPPR